MSLTPMWIPSLLVCRVMTEIPASDRLEIIAGREAEGPEGHERQCGPLGVGQFGKGEAAIGMVDDGEVNRRQAANQLCHLRLGLSRPNCFLAFRLPCQREQLGSLGHGESQNETEAEVTHQRQHFVERGNAKTDCVDRIGSCHERTSIPDERGNLAPVHP